MPGGNRTGPVGAGPMTGRAAGFCAGFGMPGYANPVGGRGMGMGSGGGFGLGKLLANPRCDRRSDRQRLAGNDPEQKSQRDDDREQDDHQGGQRRQGTAPTEPADESLVERRKQRCENTRQKQHHQKRTYHLEE